jgi:hypothetical protein
MVHRRHSGERGAARLRPSRTFVSPCHLVKSPESSQVFSSKVLEADEELLGNSTDVVAARKLLMIEEGPIGRMNDRLIYKAVNRVLAYRILDICQWVKKNEPSLNSTVIPPLDNLNKGLLDKLVRTDAPICRSSLIYFQFCRRLPK